MAPSGGSVSVTNASGISASGTSDRSVNVTNASYTRGISANGTSGTNASDGTVRVKKC